MTRRQCTGKAVCACAPAQHAPQHRNEHTALAHTVGPGYHPELPATDGAGCTRASMHGKLKLAAPARPGRVPRRVCAACSCAQW
jgi:hypothetical protein